MLGRLVVGRGQDWRMLLDTRSRDLDRWVGSFGLLPPWLPKLNRRRNRNKTILLDVDKLQLVYFAVCVCALVEVFQHKVSNRALGLVWTCVIFFDCVGPIGKISGNGQVNESVIVLVTMIWKKQRRWSVRLRRWYGGNERRHNSTRQNAILGFQRADVIVSKCVGGVSGSSSCNDFMQEWNRVSTIGHVYDYPNYSNVCLLCCCNPTTTHKQRWKRVVLETGRDPYQASSEENFRNHLCSQNPASFIKISGTLITAYVIKLPMLRWVENPNCLKYGACTFQLH